MQRHSLLRVLLPTLPSSWTNIQSSHRAVLSLDRRKTFMSFCVQATVCMDTALIFKSTVKPALNRISPFKLKWDRFLKLDTLFLTNTMIGLGFTCKIAISGTISATPCAVSISSNVVVKADENVTQVASLKRVTAGLTTRRFITLFSSPSLRKQTKEKFDLVFLHSLFFKLLSQPVNPTLKYSKNHRLEK